MCARLQPAESAGMWRCIHVDCRSGLVLYIVDFQAVDNKTILAEQKGDCTTCNILRSLVAHKGAS